MHIDLSPVTRIEGHLAIHTEAEPAGGPGKAVRIARARCEGEMFRGFEVLLRGRDPLDAQQITQRICGACPVSHGVASVRAQEMAYGIRPCPNGRLLQDLILAASTLQSHIMHFYLLALPDFADARAQRDGDRAAAAPLLPRMEGAYLADAEVNRALLAHYAEALEIRRVAHEMAAVFAGRMPHAASIVPGGCTQPPTDERRRAYRARLQRLQAFVERTLLADVAALAQAFPAYWQLGAGYGNLLCFGSLSQSESGDPLLASGSLVGGKWQPLDAEAITEEVACSWFSSPGKLHPARGQTQPDPRKPAGYSWIKAPRYKGLPMEVGPAARILVNYHSPRPWPARAEFDKFLKSLGVGPEKMVSVLGRLACRAFESLLIVRQAAVWLEQLDPRKPCVVDFKPVKRGSGYGLVEAPRGALGHWLAIEDGRISHYQCVVPTSWNCSPRDDAGQPGPLEKALEGLPLADPQQPLEVGRVARSFDPCLACAVH